MSTMCRHTLKSVHEYNQCLSEIQWTKNRIKEVELQIQKRPSKIRHLNDLLRQLQDRFNLIQEFDSRN